jgi:DNA-binding CsgD family transcriptional regulator
VVVIEGPPGVGKTELLAALGGIAADAGLEVLRARGGELEQGFAFGVVRQLLEAPVREGPQEQRSELLAGAAALAAPLVDPAGTADPSGPAADPFPIMHGLYWLCANLADRRPLAIIVDDAHWADTPSLRWLNYLARRLDGVPALLALAARSTEPEAPVESIEAIKAEARCELLRPAELTESASAKLLAERLEAEPAPELASKAHRITGGNPFLLSELARSLAAEGVRPDAAAAARLGELGPETIARGSLSRLENLPDPARALARAAALFSADAPLRHAATLAGLAAESDALAAADTLAAAGFLDPAGLAAPQAELRFLHPLIRQALYTDLPAGERARRHKQAARVLVGEGGQPERAAGHLMQTAPAADPWVVDRLRAAAAEARAAGAPEIAAAYLRRALTEPPAEAERAQVLFELGSAEAMIEGEAAIEHLREALEHVTEPRLRGPITELLARRLFFSGNAEEAVAVAQREIEELGEADPEWRKRLQAIVLFAGTMEPSFASVGEELDSRLRLGEEGDRTSLGERALLGLVAFRRARSGAPASEATALARRALEGDLLLTRDNGGAGFLVAALVLTLADSELALATYTAARDFARKRGDGFGLTCNQVHSGHAHLLRGELAKAVEAGAEGLEIGLDYGAASAPAWGTAFLADALMESGDLDGAWQALARATTDEQVPDSAHWDRFLDTRSRLRIASGDLRGGLEETLALGRRYTAVGGRNPAFIPWRSRAALCLVRLEEEPERARELAAEEVELARTWGAPRALGVALQAQGLVLGGEEGLALLREAVEVLDGSIARLEHARALGEYGAALRRAGRRGEAREPLEAAIELARACGATPIAERAHSELRLTGARPRSLVFTGVDSLTPRERQVAELAAAGRANPEIAQELYVTRKTIEHHLGSIYRKLDLESREGLAGALMAERR